MRNCDRNQNGGGIKAIVTAATIRFDKIQYEVSYFYEGEYKTAWLDKEEFTIDQQPVKSIGFRQQIAVI